MDTMNVYFDIPSKRCVVLLEVYVANYSAKNVQANLSSMMEAEAVAIDEATYNKIKKEYGE